MFFWNMAVQNGVESMWLHWECNDPDTLVFQAHFTSFEKKID